MLFAGATAISIIFRQIAAAKIYIIDEIYGGNILWFASINNSQKKSSRSLHPPYRLQYSPLLPVRTQIHVSVDAESRSLDPPDKYMSNTHKEISHQSLPGI